MFKLRVLIHSSYEFLILSCCMELMHTIFLILREIHILVSSANSRAPNSRFRAPTGNVNQVTISHTLKSVLVDSVPLSLYMKMIWYTKFFDKTTKNQ